jgi:DNA-binding CsgD family transcriptional regulator
MSRERVITGTDERGRPQSRWADPEPAASEPYGFMEPAHTATIERRKATPQELEAARAREADPTHLTVASIAKPSVAVTRDDAHMQASRMNGAARHVEVVRRAGARKVAPTPEEKIVSEPAQDVTTETPEPPAVDVGLDRLATAAESARVAWDAKAAADTAWDIAREALAVAYGSVADLVEPMPTPPDDDHAHQILTIPVASLEAPSRIETGGRPAPRRTVREERTEGLTDRQAKAIELMQAGKTRAEIAREMGTTYQTIDGLLGAAAKKKLLPVELIPLLPARFAKLTGATP